MVVAVIKDTLLHMNLVIGNCCCQCYNEASNMAGSRSGYPVGYEEPRAVYMHCYSNVISLAVGDTVRQITLLRDTLNTTGEISKLLKYCP